MSSEELTHMLTPFPLHSSSSFRADIIKTYLTNLCSSYGRVPRFVVLTLTHNTMQSVVAGQAPITLEWKKYLGSKNRGKKTSKEESLSLPKKKQEKKSRIFASSKKYVLKKNPQN